MKNEEGQHPCSMRQMASQNSEAKFSRNVKWRTGNWFCEGRYEAQSFSFAVAYFSLTSFRLRLVVVFAHA